MVKVYPAHRNLGCLGFRIGKTYFDFHKTWSRKIQMFISSPIIIRLGLSPNGKGWMTIRGWRRMR